MSRGGVACSHRPPASLPPKCVTASAGNMGRHPYHNPRPLTPLSVPSQPTTQPRETSVRTQHTTMCDRWEDCASKWVQRCAGCKAGGQCGVGVPREERPPKNKRARLASYRSRHCFPFLPGRWSPTMLHRRVPNLATKPIIFSSSSGVHLRTTRRRLSSSIAPGGGNRDGDTLFFFSSVNRQTTEMGVSPGNMGALA